MDKALQIIWWIVLILIIGMGGAYLKLMGIPQILLFIFTIFFIWLYHLTHPFIPFIKSDKETQSDE